MYRARRPRSTTARSTTTAPSHESWNPRQVARIVAIPQVGRLVPRRSAAAANVLPPGTAPAGALSSV